MSRSALSLLILLLLASCKSPSDPSDGDKPKVYSSITGTVRRAHTTDALAGVRVTSSPATKAVLTDANGNYRIDSILTGTYTLSFERSGFATAKITTIIPDASPKVVDIGLDELPANGQAVVHLTVLHAATKKPLQQVEVFKYAESRGFTDADGHVAIEEAIGSAMSYPIVRPGCNRELKTIYFDKALSYDTVYLTDYAPMLAWYAFAKNGADSSGNRFDLEMNGGSFVHDRNGLKERAIELDGVKDFLRLSHKPELNIGVEDDLTICFWVKCSGTRPAHESILHKSEGTGEALVGYEVGLNSVGGGDAAAELTIGSTLGVQRVYDPFKANYSSGQWHLLVVRIDRKERLIDFWNIGQDAEAQVLGGNMDNNGDLIIGRGSDGTFFKGTLDEIMIFKGYLTVEDLRYLEAKK